MFATTGKATAAKNTLRNVQRMIGCRLLTGGRNETEFAKVLTTSLSPLGGKTTDGNSIIVFEGSVEGWGEGGGEGQ